MASVIDEFGRNRYRSSQRENNTPKKKKMKEDSSKLHLKHAEKVMYTGSVIIDKATNVNKLNKISNTRFITTSAFSNPKIIKEVRRYRSDILSDSDNLVLVKPLLVLDVNGILCHRLRRREKDPNILYRKPIGDVAETPIIPRSDLIPFLLLLDQYFTLAIWTSARSKNADKILDLLIPTTIQKRFLFVWGQEKCNVVVQNKKHIFIKSLSKVWNAYEPLWHPLNTFLLDDSPEKCPPCYSFNAFHPPSILGGQIIHGHRRGGNDEWNQKKQWNFFQEFSNFWCSQFVETHYDRLSHRSRLHRFLQYYAWNHMNWRP